MKIAIANNLYFPYNRGGAETVVRNQISELKNLGHDVFLISCRPKKENPPVNLDLKIYYLESNYSRLGSLPNYCHLIWHIKNTFSFAKSAAIKKILVSEKPDLLITHNIMGLGFRLPKVLRKLKIRHEHYLHDIQLLHPSGLMMFGQEKIVDSLGAKIYQIFTRAFFASPAKIVSPSFWLLGQHRQRGFFCESETEIRSFNDNSALPASIKKPPFTNYLFVGQIETHKGILLLIKSFLSALELNPNLKLNIIGDGSILPQAKELAKSSAQISFLGRLDKAGVISQMQANDCLVIPSLCYENTPMTIHEAHGAGLSVLAANIGGIPEIIKSGDRLFTPSDYIDLKNKLLEK